MKLNEKVLERIKWTGFGFISFVILVLAVAAANEDTINEPKVETEVVEVQEPVEEVKHTVIGKDFSEIETRKPRQVRNDVNGKLRLLTTAERVQMQEYAVDYFNRNFETDDMGEVHYIVNYTLDTTTQIINLGTILEVNVFEYVNKEEHDASTLGTGMLYARYHVDKETAEIEKIQ